MARPGPAPQVPDHELLDVISRRDVPFATAGDVAEEVDLSRVRAAERLNRLANEEKIERGVVGERVVIYWNAFD